MKLRSAYKFTEYFTTCPIDHYLQDDGITCSVCKPGHECTKPGLTWESMNDETACPPGTYSNYADDKSFSHKNPTSKCMKCQPGFCSGSEFPACYPFNEIDHTRYPHVVCTKSASPP